MSDVQKIIADTMALHFLERNLRIHETERTEWWECVGCGWESERFDLNDSEVEAEIHRVKRAHVATAIDTALGGLTREGGSAVLRTVGWSCYCGSSEMKIDAKSPTTCGRGHEITLPPPPGFTRSRWVSGWVDE